MRSKTLQHTNCTTTVYSHPDGFELTYGEHELTACTPDGIALSMPIGVLGLAELAEKLTAIANDSGNQSEQYGAESAIDCLNELLATDSASERITTIQNAILSLQNAAHPERAAGGFAVVLESVIERGLECLS